MQKNSISVVLPAYNESENIKRSVEETFAVLSENFSDFEIVVVDDGSKDSTYDICTSLKSGLGNKLRIIRHQKNRGYGAALRSGLFTCQKDLIFYTDADNQFDIAEISDFVKQIEDCDLVIGFRVGRKDPKLRKFFAFSYNCLIRLVFGLKVKDIDCSFKLFKKDTLQKLSIERDNFFVDTELLIKSKLNGFKLKQIGVKHLARQKGLSTVKPAHIFTTLSDIFYFCQKGKLEQNNNGNN